MNIIPVNRPLITDSDIDAVINSLRNTWISGDTPPVRDLEESLCEVLGTKEAIAVSTGTSAIDLSVEALEINAGDRCVLPTFSIISTVSNLARKGAKLELVDADPITWSMDATAAAEKISDDTRLIMPVHIYGLSTDMGPILTAAKYHDVFVLEDAAEALGVKFEGQNCGTIGNAGVFSFFANKVVTGGEGGAVVTDDKLFAEKVRYFRNLCFNPRERFVHEDLGWNHRMAGMSATLIGSQLKRLEDLVTTKISQAEFYLQGLNGHPWFTFQPRDTTFSTNTYWVFGILLNEECKYDAAQLRNILLENGVDTRRFFFPMHLQPVFKGVFDSETDRFPVAENLWNRGLYIPSGLGTTEIEQEKVIQVLWEVLK
jgi:perosamine synthetase